MSAKDFNTDQTFLETEKQHPSLSSLIEDLKKTNLEFISILKNEVSLVLEGK